MVTYHFFDWQLIVKIHMTDNSTKTLMVDERQTVRDILDNLFEKTHCDCTIEWCLYEENPELQIGKHASRQGRYPSFIKNPSLKFPNMTKVEQADNKRSLFILFSYLSKHFNSRNCS